MTQQEALQILKMGQNVFLTGAAGSGKTHVLNSYVNYLRENGAYSAVGVTASTGIAATHMGGMTIHAWSGLGVRDSLSDRDIDDLEERQYLWKRFEKARVLIIDEISMLHHFRLDLIERIVRSFKRNEEPFGGLQVILCGDFFQLPPVARTGEPPAKFAYHSGAWDALGLKMCYLEESHRHQDKAFLEILNAIRDDAVTEEIVGRLRSRFNKNFDGKLLAPTKLYSHNVNVDAENERELAKIPGEEHAYGMAERGHDHLAAALRKSCLAPERLRLKVGARVMFVKNNFEMGYANGTLGRVTECDASGVTVKTNNGETVRVERANWRVEDGGRTLAEITQYPLRLAWAITVHKSQGMSLDAAEIDLSQSFEKGMGYVALSRVRTLSGLSLKGLNGMALKVHPEVLEYDKKFREESARRADELRGMKAAAVSDAAKEFLARIVPKSGSAKKDKPQTTLETKRLVLEGKSLTEIAEERGLKVKTIVGHIEKLLAADSKFDLSHIKKEISAERFKKIAAAFRKAAASAKSLPAKSGTLPPLSPVKSILGADFSFDEIRLARLFL